MYDKDLDNLKKKWLLVESDIGVGLGPMRYDPFADEPETNDSEFISDIESLPEESNAPRYLEMYMDLLNRRKSLSPEEQKKFFALDNWYDRTKAEWERQGRSTEGDWDDLEVR